MPVDEFLGTIVPTTEHELTFDGVTVTVDLCEDSVALMKALTVQDGTVPERLRALLAPKPVRKRKPRVFEGPRAIEAPKPPVNTAEDTGNSGTETPEIPQATFAPRPAGVELDAKTRAAIRAWAKGRGYKIGTTGRIPAEYVTEYLTSH